jgi:DNA-binding response OmpR family regulator
MAKILVIDDDDLMNDMVMELLTVAGYEVESAGDGDQALRQLGVNTFDLIITDIVMPEKEGLETIVAIRKKNKAVPIIAISGGGKLGPTQYLQLAHQFGANYTFHKPNDNAA